MKNRLALGFSSAESFSRSEHSWKDRLRTVGLLLCALGLLGLFFGYVSRTVEHGIPATHRSDAGLEQAAP
ncbi:MAG: hypothetical protein LAN59_02555 [Acidobacteriia bacterium]|nr:hypothetical protein [Terriglobia bacterium]